MRTFNAIDQDKLKDFLRTRIKDLEKEKDEERKIHGIGSSGVYSIAGQIDELQFLLDKLN